MAVPAPSVDPGEVERFSALARTWWDPKGAMAPLHRMNPARLGFLRQALLDHFGRDPGSLAPFEGLALLDIGCGGGLVAEPMARLGFAVAGLDASAANLAVARAHAEAGGLAIDYRDVSLEALSETGERFDAILALEVVEHVADLDRFVAAAAQVLKPGGVLIASTLNRTPKSFLLAIVGAEYVLRWLPRGTHRWDRFLRPSELAAAFRRQGLAVGDLKGFTFDVLAGEWRASTDLSVNYFVVATKVAAGMGLADTFPPSALAPEAFHP